MSEIDAIEDAWIVPDFGSTMADLSDAIGLKGFDDR
jgi:hypothetical protein